MISDGFRSWSLEMSYKLFGVSVRERGTHTQLCSAQLKGALRNCFESTYTNARDLSFLEPWIPSKTCKKRKRSPPVCKNDSERTNEHTKEFQNDRIPTIKANLLFLVYFLLDRNGKCRWTAFWTEFFQTAQDLTACYEICQIFLFLSKDYRRKIYLFLLVKAKKFHIFHYTTMATASRDRWDTEEGQAFENLESKRKGKSILQKLSAIL